MPAIAHQNKILGNTSGGGSTILVTTSESSLYGQTITLSDGTTTLSGTFSNTGECEFTGVMMTGNLTLACSGVSQNISVPYFGNYSFMFSLFSATVNVTYPYSEGATCTLSDGTTTLIATGSPMAFTVPNAGTWTASVTLDGVSKTDTATITTDGQVASISIIFGTINVTYDDDFRGISITCTQGATTITKTAPAGNTMTFYPPTTGVWEVSGTVGGVAYPKNVTVSSLSTPVSVTLETIPDGSTATPVNDIQTWLDCGGIFNKSYTTINQVLADTTTLLALISDNNAVDYMVRSTNFAADICANAIAMTDIGANNYCADTLLSDATWASAIANSTYFESVLNVKVPTMTSDTTPSGVCSAAPLLSASYPAYLAFNGVSNNNTVTSGSTNGYIAYEFTSPMKLKRVDYRFHANTSESIKDYEIQGYDGSNWVTLKSGTLSAVTTLQTIVDTFGDTAYSKFRIHAINNNGGVNICYSTVQFYGRS